MIGRIRLGAALLLLLSAAVAVAETPGVRSVRAGGLRAEIAAVILSGQDGGAIPVEAVAVPLERRGDKVRVRLAVEAGGAALAAEHPGGALRFEVYAYAVAADGALRGALWKTFEADPETLPRLTRSGVKVLGDLDLLPGEYALRVLVRNPATERLGLRLVALAVPGPEAGSLAAPVVTEDEDAWILLDETAAPGDGPLPLPPAARPVLYQGGEVGLRLVFHGAGEAAGEVRLQLFDATGYQVVELTARRAGESTFADVCLVDVTVRGEELPEGAYRLRAVVVSGAGEGLVSATLPVVVVGRPPAAPAATWASLERAPAVVRPAPRLAAAPPTVDLEALEERYMSALEALARGDDAAARALVWGLVEEATGSADNEPLKALERVERRAARAIAKERPRGLGPIMLFYHQMYEEARRRGRAPVSTHARTTTLGLAELFADKAPAGWPQAAQVMASLGCELQQSGLMLFSQQVLARALVLAPDNLSARLATAFTHEKMGDADAAVNALRDLVALHPEHGEGRLRLAVNLARTLQGRGARRHLRQIVEADSAPAWVLSLAHQELAALRLRGGDLEEAQELLEAGLSRLPGDEKIALQLAFVYDAQARTRSADEVLATIASGAGASPRRLYTQWPADDLAAMRRELRATSDVQREELAAALLVAFAEEKP